MEYSFLFPMMQKLWTSIKKCKTYSRKATGSFFPETVYIVNSESYDDWLKGHQIGNQTWAIDWHYKLWRQMTLNPFSSRSLKFDMKYFENGDRSDDGVNRSRIGNHLCAIDWHNNYWPWLALYRPRSQEFHFKYLENDEKYDVELKGCNTGNNPWTFDWHYKLWPSTPHFKVIKIGYQIFRKRWQIRWCCQRKSNRKPPVCYRLAPWPLTLVDPEPSKSRSPTFHFKLIKYISRTRGIYT